MVRYGGNTSCIACYLVTHSGTFIYIQKNSTHLQGKWHTVCKQVTQAIGAVGLVQRLLQSPVVTLCVMQMFVRIEEKHNLAGRSGLSGTNNRLVSNISTCAQMSTNVCTWDYVLTPMNHTALLDKESQILTCSTLMMWCHMSPPTIVLFWPSESKRMKQTTRRALALKKPSNTGSDHKEMYQYFLLLHASVMYYVKQKPEIK